MKRYMRQWVGVISWLMLSALGVGGEGVSVMKSPGGWIQPQAVVDDQGTLHLLFFKGKAVGGDLFYVKKLRGSTSFTEPMRVNTKENSAVAVGTVRGGQVALGKSGRIHVAWNGAGKNGGMCYARLNDMGTAFEQQRNLMKVSDVADGGCTLAADETGLVCVAWHAVKKGERGEANRKMWLAKSLDEGASFQEEMPAWDEPTGACGCCSTRALADGAGNFYFLYRSAKEGDSRDLYLLTSQIAKGTTQGVLLHRWQIRTCPMSTYALARGPDGIVAAWDTKGEIFWTKIKPGTTEFSAPRVEKGFAREQKHPAVAVNSKGSMLIAWTEGTGWQRGGDLCWQMYDKNGKPTTEAGRSPGAVPVWGLVSVVADGERFVVIH